MVDMNFLNDNVPFWDELEKEDKRKVRSGSIETFYKKGTIIHRSEDKCSGLVIIKSGQLRTYIISDEGREVTLYRVQKDEICVLSASCLLDTIIFDILIDAVEDTEVIIIPHILLKYITDKYPSVELYLYKKATERFSDVMWTVQQILFTGIDKRVAVFLWDEYTKTKDYTLTYTHDEIARYIGSAREVVTKVLKYFSQEGIVELSRGKIKILSKEKLKKLI